MLFISALGYQIISHQKDKQLQPNGIKYLNLLEFQYRPYMRHLLKSIINKDYTEQKNNAQEPLQFGQYYSNWSPYKPYEFTPLDIDLKQTTHVYYSFIGIDKKTCRLYLMDKFSDTEFTNKKLGDKHKNKGLIMEFNSLRLGIDENNHLLDETNPNKFKKTNQESNNFKLVMSIGGWSQAESFYKLAHSSECLNTFVESCIDMMIANGFDGVDIDWEYPKNKKEYQAYVTIFKKLRKAFDSLEQVILGKNYNKNKRWFHLSTAIPCDIDILKKLHLTEIEPLVDGFNLMAYDLSGEWSQKTAYQANLFSYDSDTEDSNDIDSVVSFLLRNLKIGSKKIILGVPLYGRSFTNVDTDHQQNVIGTDFDGVDNWFDKNSPGIWPTKEIYKLKGYNFFHDKKAVASYLYNQHKKHLIVFDDYACIKAKGEYINQKKLGGGFFWEANGDVIVKGDSMLSFALSDNHHLYFDKTGLESIWQTRSMKDFYANKVELFQDHTLNKQSQKIAQMLDH